jgi:hypothetical protein
MNLTDLLLLAVLIVMFSFSSLKPRACFGVGGAGQPDRRSKKRPWRRRSVRTCSTSLSNFISRGSAVFANAYMRRTPAVSADF